MRARFEIVVGVGVLLSALAVAVTAQQPQSGRVTFESLTFEDGLSDERVFEIFQDSRGFLWFGTHALNVATQVHTSPAMFGKVMSQITPRMAVGYHVFNDFDTQPQIISEIRQTYSGPVELAVDYMVFNVTKDDIRVRMAVIDEDIWPLPSITKTLPADPKDRVGFSDFITGGRVV